MFHIFSYFFIGLLKCRFSSASLQNYAGQLRKRAGSSSINQDWKRISQFCGWLWKSGHLTHALSIFKRMVFFVDVIQFCTLWCTDHFEAQIGMRNDTLPWVLDWPFPRLQRQRQAPKNCCVGHDASWLPGPMVEQWLAWTVNCISLIEGA